MPALSTKYKASQGASTLNKVQSIPRCQHSRHSTKHPKVPALSTKYKASQGASTLNKVPLQGRRSYNVLWWLTSQVWWLTSQVWWLTSQVWWLTSQVSVGQSNPNPCGGRKTEKGRTRFGGGRSSVKTDKEDGELMSRSRKGEGRQ